MNKNVMKALATISHPAFHPFIALMIMPDPNRFKLEFYMMLLWLILIQFVLLALYRWYADREELKDLSLPTVEIRQWTFGKYLASNILLIGLSLYFYKSILIFFLSQVLITFVLYQISSFKAKWSWHAAAWANLTTLFAGLYILEEIAIWPALGALLISAVVVYLRYKQGAHSKKELLFGFSAGLVLTIFSFAFLILVK